MHVYTYIYIVHMFSQSYRDKGAYSTVQVYTHTKIVMQQYKNKHKKVSRSALFLRLEKSCGDAYGD